MSGNAGYPPPGSGPSGPSTPPPGWGPPPPGWSPPPGPPPPGWAPGLVGPVHRPGAVPLRPLGLGDIYDAAFRTIRFNPAATVGAAVLVAGIAMAIPVLITAVLSATSGLALVDDQSSADVLGSATALGALGLGGVLQYVGMIFVTGMIAHVVAAAAVGRRMTLGEAWAATRGTRWRLVGLTLLIALIWIVLLGVYAGLSTVLVLMTSSLLPIVLWFVLTVPAMLVLSAWLWVRATYLAVAALALERIGVGAAIARGWRLTSRQFWRTFGIGLLTALVTSVAAQVLTIPFSIVGQVVTLAAADSGVAVLLLVVVNALGSVVSTAFVAPFTASVATLQYLDQRMRKEAYDVELLAQAGITAS